MSMPAGTDLLTYAAQYRATAHGHTPHGDDLRAGVARPYTGTTHPYVAAALRGVCEHLAAMSEDTGRNSYVNAQVWRFAGYAAAGHIDEAIALADLREAALRSGLGEFEVRKLLRPDPTGALAVGRATPLDPPPRTDPTSTSSGPLQPWTPPPPGVDPTTGEVLTTPAGDAEPGAHPEATTGHAAAAAGLDDDDIERRRHEQLTLAEVRSLRARNAARELVDDERHAATFRVPEYTDTLAAELELPDAPVRYAVEQLVPAASNVLLAAQFKAGKSTLMLNLARAVADSTPFLGQFDVHAPEGRFALFNYEVERAQLRAWLRESRIMHPERVSVLNLRGYTLPLTVPRVASWVVEWLKAHEVRWWCLDPFARAFTGANENDNTEVARWLDALDEVKARAGVEVLIMPAHTGRETFEPGTERVRGATRLDDWADVRWLLTRDEHGGRFLRATGRDVDVPEQALTYTEATRALAFGGHDRAGAARRGVEDVIVAAVQQHPGIGVRDLRQRARDAGLKGRNDRLDAAIEAAVRYRRITREDHGNAGVRHYPVGAAPTPAAWTAPTLSPTLTPTAD